MHIAYANSVCYQREVQENGAGKRVAGSGDPPPSASLQDSRSAQDGLQRAIHKPARGPDGGRQTARIVPLADSGIRGLRRGRIPDCEATRVEGKGREGLPFDQEGYQALEAIRAEIARKPNSAH